MTGDQQVTDGRRRAAWLSWLGAHQHEPAGVWLVLARKGTTRPTSLTYDQALEEALCHGWIDGQARRRDDTTYHQRFTPRRVRSPWSQRNVGLVARLAEQGRMQPAGLTEVERAKADGRWEAAYAGPATMEVPDDLAVRSRLPRRRRRCSPSSPAGTVTPSCTESAEPSASAPALDASSSSSPC